MFTIIVRKKINKQQISRVRRSTKPKNNNMKYQKTKTKIFFGITLILSCLEKNNKSIKTGRTCNKQIKKK
jgi:hypothetical protein